MTWASQDEDSMVNPSTIDPRADGAIGFKPECSPEAFYGNCADEDVAFAQSRLVARGALLEHRSKHRQSAGVELRGITLSATATAL